MVERLDHFDPADVLHDGRVHALSRGQHPLIAGFVILHHAHVAQQTNGKRDQRDQGDTPVQEKQICRHQNGDQQVCCQLRDHMSQRQLQLLHRIHQQRFMLSGGGVQNGSHGHPGELGRQGGTDLFQDGKCRAMAQHRGRSGQPHIPQIAQQPQGGAARNSAQAVLAAADQYQDPGYRQVGYHTAGTAKRRQQDGGGQLPSARPGKAQQPPDGVVFLLFQMNHSF